LFAYQRAGVAPDIMAIAKALGSGFPVGAFLGTTEAAKGMVPGTHGSTFGGNPLAMSVGNAVLDVMTEPGFFTDVQRKAIGLRQRLAEVVDRYPDIVSEVRGEGLLAGLKAVVPSGELVDALRAEKMITVAAGDNVVRLLPPLIISEDEIAEGVARIDRACARLRRSRAEQKAAQPGAAG
jgi:acetylornithine/N-succinyldiaminopimelate aminotransferase